MNRFPSTLMGAALLASLATFLLVSICDAQNQTPAQIKALITADNSWQFIGIGGRYGYMKTVVSKNHTIESDHFPPKSIYRDAASAAIRDLSSDDLAAVSLRYAHHRSLITTNNPAIGTAQARLIIELRQLFRVGNYSEAISRNIGWYRSNPDRDGNVRDRFDQYIKEGVKLALEIHLKNGLITLPQKQQLIQRHGLEIRNPVLTNLLNLPLRDRAKYLIADDVRKYVRRPQRRPTG